MTNDKCDFHNIMSNAYLYNYIDIKYLNDKTQ